MRSEVLSELHWFFEAMGYDTVSFERCIGPVMLGSGTLGNHAAGSIQQHQRTGGYGRRVSGIRVKGEV